MRSSRRTVVIVAVVVLIVALAALVWWLLGRDSSTPDPQPSPSVTASATATASPSPSPTPTVDPEPTEDPAEPTQPAEPTEPDPAAPAPTAVDVVTTYAFWNTATSALEAAGYANTVESDGICTMTATQGTTVVTVQSPAALDASTTACGGLALGRAQVGSGSWQVVISYASSTSVGSAAPITVEIP